MEQRKLKNVAILLKCDPQTAMEIFERLKKDKRCYIVGRQPYISDRPIWFYEKGV